MAPERALLAAVVLAALLAQGGSFCPAPPASATRGQAHYGRASLPWAGPSMRRQHRTAASLTMQAPSLDRRSLLRSSVAAGAALLLPGGEEAVARGGYGSQDYDWLKQRVFGPMDQDYRNPGFQYDVCFGLCSDKQVYLPDWLQGTWEVKSTYVGKAFPAGEQYVYRNMKEGTARSATEKEGDTMRFLARNLPSTKGGTLLGAGKGGAAVIHDRAFNTAQMLNAYAGYRRVLNVEYNPEKDPTRMLMEYPSAGPDMQPLPNKRTEVFINNRDFAQSADGRAFAVSECYRAVTLGPRQTAVADSENAVHYELLGDGSVRGKQRSFVYLVPQPSGREGDLYMQVGSRAVAVYDYEIEMRKQQER